MDSESKTMRRSRHSSVEDAGETIKALFCAYYELYAAARVGVSKHFHSSPYWDGGVYKGRKRKNIWLAAAQCISDAEVNPAEFIEYVTRWHAPIMAPCPTWLISDKVIKAFLSRKQQHDPYEEDNTKRELESSKTHMWMLLGDYRDRAARGLSIPDLGTQYRIILADPNAQLNVLFRYCWAASIGFKELEKELLQSAILHYLPRSAHYEKTWQVIIPERLREYRDLTNISRILEATT